MYSAVVMSDETFQCIEVKLIGWTSLFSGTVYGHMKDKDKRYQKFK